jgi:hypothetical protein
LVRTPLSPLLLSGWQLSDGGILVLCIVAQEDDKDKYSGQLNWELRRVWSPVAYLYPPIHRLPSLTSPTERARSNQDESQEETESERTQASSVAAFFAGEGRRKEFAILILSRQGAEGSPSLDEGVITGNWNTIFLPHPTSFLARTAISWTFITSFRRRCRLL